MIFRVEALLLLCKEVTHSIPIVRVALLEQVCRAGLSQRRHL